METLLDIAQSNTWLLIWPEITLGILALGLLVATMVCPKWPANRFFLISFGGQLLVLVTFITLWCCTDFMAKQESGFGNLWIQTPRHQWMRCFLLLSALPLNWLGTLYLKSPSTSGLAAEFYAIISIVTAALMLMVQSQHFILFFVALETAAVGFYILVSYSRQSALSLEAGLKYLILGALSSAIMLFGIVLLYGSASHPGLNPTHMGSVDALHFDHLGTFIAANGQHLWVQAGAILVVVGLAFKIGVFPFQIWIPDVYQGAPMPTAAFLAVGSKAAGVFALLHLVRGPFSSLDFLLIPLLSTAAVLTLLFGNLAALSQRNVKRLMGLSGIAHAGYLLIGVVAAFTVPWAEAAVGFYLLTYYLGAFAVFGVMGYVAGSDESSQELLNYSGLGQNQPFLATVLAMGLGSLAGIPPLAGFAGKLLLFLAGFEAELYGLLICGLIGVLLGVYYYLSWIRDAVFALREGTTTATSTARLAAINVGTAHRWIWGSLAAGTVVFGLYQGGLLHLLLP